MLVAGWEGECGPRPSATILPGASVCNGMFDSCVWSGFTIEDMIWDGMGLGGLFMTLSLGGIKGMGVGNTGRTGRIWLFSSRGWDGLGGAPSRFVFHDLPIDGAFHIRIRTISCRYHGNKFHRRCAICVAHCLLSLSPVVQPDLAKLAFPAAVSMLSSHRVPVHILQSLLQPKTAEHRASSRLRHRQLNPQLRPRRHRPCRERSWPGGHSAPARGSQT